MSVSGVAVKLGLLACPLVLLRNGGFVAQAGAVAGDMGGLSSLSIGTVLSGLLWWALKKNKELETRCVERERELEQRAAKREEQLMGKIDLLDAENRHHRCHVSKLYQCLMAHGYEGGSLMEDFYEGPAIKRA